MTEGRVYQVVTEDGLYLALNVSSDMGQEPSSLRVDTFATMIKWSLKVAQYSALHHYLGLLIRTSHYIFQGP